MADEENMAPQQDESQVEAGAEEKAEHEKLKEKLDVSVEEIGTLRKKVTISVPREFIDERVEKQYGDLSRDAVVPGFRKGRAPRRLLEKRFGMEVGQTITSELLGSGYLAAIEKVDLKVLGDPLVYCKPKKAEKEGEEPVERLMAVREAFDNIVLPAEGPFKFACEVEVQPQFEVPSLDAIPIEKPKVDISDEDVDTQVDRFRAMRGVYEPVDGGIQEDDMVSADMKMTVDGKVIHEVENAEFAARPQRVYGVTLADLGDKIEGKKAGDVCTISGTVPEDDEKAELRGKAAEFQLTIKGVRRMKLPELTQEMLEPIGFESVEDFKKYIRSDMEARLSDVIKRGMRSQVYQYLLDNVKIDLPERLSQKQANRAVMRRMVDLYRQGVPEAEVAKKMDELKTTAQADAVRELKLSFIMEKIAEELKPEVTEDEVNGQIAMIAQQQNRRFDRVRDELIRNESIDSLYVQIRDEKIVDALLEKAKVTETEAPKKEKGKKKGKSAKSSETDSDAT